MFKYKLGDDIYSVPAEEVDIFEAETPDAIKITDEEEGKINGVADKGATVTPTTGPAPEKKKKIKCFRRSCYNATTNRT
jgi:hypothetical protein